MKEFNFNSQVCTDKVQSERLLAIGLKPETADMCWIEERGWNDEKREIFYTGNYFVRPIDYVWDDNYINHIPAWSLHRLIEIVSHTQYPYYVISKELPIYDALCERIEWLIKEGYFNKEYLNGTTED